jgi:hypothetical protein
LYLHLPYISIGCDFYTFGQVSKGADAYGRNLHLHLLHLPCVSKRWPMREGEPMMPSNVILFPRRHRGDPPARQLALARIGFRWHEGLWRRGRVRLSDAQIDSMEATVWTRRLQRWTQRRPRCGRR